MTGAAQYDTNALAVARSVHDAVRPAVTILFGSRARGDYRPDSDIDLLLIADQSPDLGARDGANAVAIDCVRRIYRAPVECQVIWKTAAEAALMRRTVNHIVARAYDEGVIMQRDPSQNPAEGSSQGTDYEWSVTDERIRHAEQHLLTFRYLADGDMPDHSIGQHAQQAMEHALKAHISAAGVRYERAHNLHILWQQVQDADPDFDFTPESDYGILNQYAGSSDYYEPARPITEQADYRRRVESDVTRLLNRVAVIRPQV